MPGFGLWSPGGCCCDDGPPPCEGTFNCCPTIYDGCTVMPGSAVHVTGPGGFSFDGVADANGMACFTFDTPGSYTFDVDPPASPAGRYLSTSVTLTLSCAHAFPTITLPVHPDYVQICCCSTPTTPPFFSCIPPAEIRCLRYPISRTLNWTFGSASGTMTYRDASDPHWPRHWVGCASVQLSAYNPEAPTNGHGNDCDSYGNCVPIETESEAKLWVLLRSCMAVQDSRWTPFLNIKSCPTVGRSCSDEDFWGGEFCNGAGGEQVGTWFATFGASYTWSCNPFSITFSVTGGGVATGMVGAGGSLVISE